MAITGIDGLVYGVKDMAQARRFYTDAGLTKTKSSRTATTFETVSGARVVVRPQDAKGLPPAIQRGPTVREVVWRVSSKRHLAAIGKELARDRDVHEDSEGVLHAVDPAGIGMAFRVGKERPVESEITGSNAPANKGRVDARATYYGRATPQGISHVVFTVPDFAEQEAFYTERLGFLVSDYYRGRGVFLRSQPRAHHHNLFFLGDKNVRINHAAFAVRNIHELMAGGMYLGSKGWKTQIGPGRHIVSSAYFWYLNNPCGGAFEYHWDEDFVTEKWKPAVWDPSPDLFAEWVLADGLPRTAVRPPTRTEKDMAGKKKVRKEARAK